MIFSKQGPSEHHVYMNNPMKRDGLTFYQASYFKASEDPQSNDFGSILSVNYDPGRPIKYAGSLLLVFGAMWHYWLNRRKTEESENNKGQLI